jgi:hypothetical protein
VAYRAEIDLSVNNREALKGVTQVEGGINKLIKGVKEFERVFNEALSPKGAIQSRFQLEQERKALALFKQQNAALQNQVRLAAQLGSAYDKLQVKVVGTELRRLERARTSQRALPGGRSIDQKRLPAAGQTSGTQFSGDITAAVRAEARVREAVLAEATRQLEADKRATAAKEKIARAAQGEVSATTRTFGAPQPFGLLEPARGQRTTSAPVGSSGGSRYQQRLQAEVDRQIRVTGKLSNEILETVEKYNTVQDSADRLVKTQGRLSTELSKAAESAKSTELSTRNTTKNVKAGTEATKAARKGQGLLGFGQTATNLSAGAGFPLLFGGGPGSVLGGLGGGLLGGFGGSIIFGALGQQLDALGAAALSTADAFGKLGATASDLITKLGSGAGNGFGDRAQFLIDEGSQSQVGQILRDRFAEVYGDQALRDFEALAETNKKFKQTWTELGVQFQLLIDGPLKGLLDIVNRINFKAKKDDELTPQELKVRKLEQRNRSFGPTITQANIDELNEAKATLTETKTTQKDTNKTNAENALLDLAKQRAAIEEKVNNDKLAAVSQALTARRDELAVLNTAASITRASAELDNTRKELTAERLNAIKDIYRITQLEKTEAEQAAELERQRIAQANARALAERQILQERRALSIQDFEIRQQITNEKSKFAALSATEEKQYKLKIALIRDEYQTAVDILTVQKAVALEGKNELEVRNQITENFKKQEELALKRALTHEKEVFQAEVLRRDRLQAIADQKELNKLTAENAAIKAIDSNNPERTASFSGAGLGFFAESALIEANVIRDSAAQLEAYNEQIGALQKRIKSLSESNFGGINDDRLSIRQEQLDGLTQTRDLYAQLQPQIDAARIKQAQFNDALAAVTPGVNALVGGLQEVVAGTKTAEEAFADFLTTIADQLIQTAATLIAQYIAIGLAKAFAGLGTPVGGQTSLPGTSIGSGGGEFTNIAGNVFGTLGPNFGIRQRADGGPVSSNTPYIVGERGPELFVPFQQGNITSNEELEAQMRDTRSANMAFSSSSSSFQQLQSVNLPFTRNAEQSSMVAAERETAQAISNPAPLNVRFESQVINGVEYVTAEQHRQGMAQAAERGRSLTLSALQGSVKTRKKVGLS